MVILVDGHNNVGFSGGPVVVQDPANGEQYAIGVISGYFNDPKIISVTDKNRAEIGTGIFPENSGIIVVWPIRFVKETITKYWPHLQ